LDERVAEYFAVVGPVPSDDPPVPRGCCGFPHRILEIDTEVAGNANTSTVVNKDTFSDTESDLSRSLSIDDDDDDFITDGNFDSHDDDDDDDNNDFDDDESLASSHSSSNSSISSESPLPIYSALNLRSIWNMAIVDIIVIYYDKEETCPADYEVVIDDVNRGINSHIHTAIAVKRRRRDGRPDHITDIRLVTSRSSVPEGFDPISKTVSNKFDANLSRGGNLYSHTYLAVRRNSEWSEENRLYSVPPTISTLFTVDKTAGEIAPEGCVLLSRNLNHGAMMGHNIFLGFFEEARTGLCDVPYESFTVDRYPKQDHNDFSLPTNELPMFVFPHGLRLLRRKRTDAPMPSFFPFVFTGLSGERIHCVCLTFFEELSDGVVRKLEGRHRRIHASVEEEIRGVEMPENKDRSKKSGDKMAQDESGRSGDTPSIGSVTHGIYAPKCICIISRFPFYRALRRFLRQLYRISLSASPAPLERYISYLVTFLPVPKPGGRPFHIHLETPKFIGGPLSGSGFSLAPIALALPPRRSLPPMDLDFNAPFRALSLPSVLNIFALLMKESQLLFLSARASLVTEVCETFRALLFPLDWQCCYVPRLPDALSACLEYPGGFILGMQLVPTLTREKSASVGSHQIGLGTRMNAEMKQKSSRQGIDINAFLEKLELQDTVHVVDLDSGTVSKAGGVGTLKRSVFSRQPYKDLPVAATQDLQDKLKTELKRVNMVAGRGDGLMDYDSAFEFAPTPDIQEKLSALGNGSGETEMNADVIRDSFLCFMAETIGNYTHYIVPPSLSRKNNQFGDLRRFLDVDKFLGDAEDHDRSSKRGGNLVNFLETLCDTQMFSVLVQQRTESSSNDHRLVFFEQCVQTFNKLRNDEDEEASKDAEHKAAASPTFISPSKRMSNMLFGSGKTRKEALNSVTNSTSESSDRHSGGDRTLRRQRSMFAQYDAENRVTGLVTQIVHDQLGNFLVDNDFTDLEDDMDGTSSSNKRPDSARSFKSANQNDKTDAESSVSYSKNAPLEIPGPSADGIELESESDGKDCDQDDGNDTKHKSLRRRAETLTLERQWNYPDGWPTPLEDSFFVYPSSALPNILVSMGEQAKRQSAQQRRLILTRNADDTAFGKKQTPIETMSPTEMILQVYGTYFMCLPTLIAKHLSGASLCLDLLKRSKEMALVKALETEVTMPVVSTSSPGSFDERILKRQANKCFIRALGIIRRIEILGTDAFSFTDEAMWRSLLITAGRIGGPRMAEVSVALFTKMKKSGIYPNAVTYGLYTQALATRQQGGKAPPLLLKSSSIPANITTSSRSSDARASITEQQHNQLCVMDEDDCLDLETDGHNWRMDNTKNSLVTGRNASSASIGFSPGRDLSSSISNASSSPTTIAVGLPPPPPSEGGGGGDKNDNGDDAPPSPTISRASSFSMSSVDGGGNENLAQERKRGGIGAGKGFVGAVGMWQSALCSSCGKRLLEEEIFAAMKSGRESNGDVDCDIKCPRCGDNIEGVLEYSIYQPRSVRACEQEESEQTDQCMKAKGIVSGIEGVVHFESNPNVDDANMTVVDSGTVRIMSPLGVRVKMEQVLITAGENSLNRSTIMKTHKMLYWNLVFYCNRLNIPVPLIQAESDEEAVKAFGLERVCVGYNKDVTESKVKTWLCEIGGWVNINNSESCEKEIDVDDPLKVEEEVDKISVLTAKMKKLAAEKSRLGVFFGKGGIIGKGKTALSASDVLKAHNKIVNVFEGGERGEGGEVGKMVELFPKCNVSEIDGLLMVKGLLCNKSATCGKRLYDVVDLVCKLRMQGKWRRAKENEDLSNLYRILLVICANFEPAGLAVIDKVRGGEMADGGAGVGRRNSGSAAAAEATSNISLDALYVKAISRLTLSAYGQLDQNDKELHFDISSARAREFRQTLGML